jgi:hypothetical protein
MNRLSTRAGLLATIGLSAACSAAVAQTVAVQPEEAEAIARDAYIYGFPMVMNYKTLWNYVVDEGNPEYKGPFNEVSCEARLFTPEDKAVVTPNADTPYCMFWMDLRAEPLVLSVPEIDPDRYYSFQLIDLYTHNFGYVGNLTTGSEAGRYLLAGPGWDGRSRRASPTSSDPKPTSSSISPGRSCSVRMTWRRSRKSRGSTSLSR